MSAFHNNMLLGSAKTADLGDPIEQSLRFVGTEYLTGSAPRPTGDFTYSLWFKPAPTTFSLPQTFLSFGTSNYGYKYSQPAAGQPNCIATQLGSGFNYLTTAALRDPSAWYHLVFKNVSNQTTLFINGVNQGTTAATPQETNNLVIGSNITGGNDDPLLGYIAEVYMVGTAYDADTFGRFNADGVWVPKTPTIASYGTQGFHLTLDPTQSNGIGHDSSGQGNHFTATGFDVTSGDSSYDVMVDSPTNNFSTMNPLDPFSDTLSDANLALSVATSQHAAPGTMALVENKYYIELTCDNPPTLSPNRQYALFLVPTSGITNANPVLSSGAYEIKVFNNTTFGVYTSNSAVLTGTLPSTPAAGFVIQVLYNADTRQLYACVDNTNWLRNNGSIASTFDAAQPTLVLAAPTSGHYTAGVTNYNGTGNINYGQQPYLHTPPTGFEALSTTNMPSAALSNTITGTFTGNNSADGPFVYTGCLPARIQYGTIDIKFQNRLSQSNVDFLSNGFKVRSTTSNNGSVSYTVTTTHDGGEYVGYQIPFNAPATAQTN